jgi:hypothetical protein
MSNTTLASRSTRPTHATGARRPLVRRHQPHYLARGREALHYASVFGYALTVGGVRVTDYRVAAAACRALPGTSSGDVVCYVPRVSREQRPEVVESATCPCCGEQADAAVVCAGLTFCWSCGGSLWRRVGSRPEGRRVGPPPIMTTYTKGGLGCCLTFTRNGHAFAIDGVDYHDVDALDFIGEPAKVHNSPPTYRCLASYVSLAGFGRPVSADDPIEVLCGVLKDQQAHYHASLPASRSL